VVEVDAARYRLRVLNGSNARRYRLLLDPPPPDGPAFVQIGSDVGLLERPAPQDRLTLAPAERVDVVVDFGRYPVGTQVTLRNDLGSGTTGAVMRFVVARRAADDARVPAVLAPAEEPLPTTGVVRRTFRFRRGTVGDGTAGWTVNDRPFDPTRMIASPRGGSVEVWRFGTDLNHPVHVHLGHFQVVSRNGKHPGDGDLWKDTVDLRALEYVDVAVRFPKLTGRYVMHCHNLEHEDMMMMAAFEVT
jgi:FtsP/CotA-like multicopper oxidase with cupredoxin domain